MNGYTFECLREQAKCIAHLTVYLPTSRLYCVYYKAMISTLLRSRKWQDILTQRPCQQYPDIIQCCYGYIYYLGYI